MKPVIVMTHPNSPSKMDALINVIDKIKHTGREIILSTHYSNIPSHIIKKIDYSIYDKRNIFLSGNNSLGWVKYYQDNFAIHTKQMFKINHTPAVHLLYVSSLSFCKYVLNLDCVHIMNYDNDWDNDDFLDYNENLLYDNNKDGIFYGNGDLGTWAYENQIEPSYMYVDVNNMWNCVSKNKTVGEIEKYISKSGGPKTHEDFLKYIIDEMDYVLGDRNWLYKNYGYKWNSEGIEPDGVINNKTNYTGVCCVLDKNDDLFIYSTDVGEYLIVWDNENINCSENITTQLNSWNLFKIGNYYNVNKFTIFKKYNDTFIEVLSKDISNKSGDMKNQYWMESKIIYNGDDG